MLTVEIKDITKYYGQQKALDNINLTINKGEVVGLLGPNGAGKSTLMKIITSFIPPSSGTIVVDGWDVQENSLEVRKRLGYLPEHNPLYQDMYIKEYLEFVLKTYPGQKNVKSKVDDIIHLTGLDLEKRKRSVHYLKDTNNVLGLLRH